MRFRIIVNYDEDSGLYWGKVAEVEGVYSQGETIKDLLNNIKEAIRLHLDISGEIEVIPVQ